VKQTLTALLLSFFLAPALEAQERVKFPIGVSSKVLGYGYLWAAWRRGFFEREGLDAEVVLMRGTAPAVQALIAQSILAGLVANDGPIAAVEQGVDLAMVASGSKITHMLIGGKNYKTWEDLRGTTLGSSTLHRARRSSFDELSRPRDSSTLATTNFSASAARGHHSPH
jgi:ABC-type nitrate/sulfonate/bicarbonate transport system substrate-binding protein